MALKSKKNRKEMNYLEITPYKIHGEEITDEGLVNVLVPRFKTEFFKKIFVPKNKSPFIRANLDELGSSTWLKIDGEKKVGQICQIVFEERKEDFDNEISNCYDRVTKFLSSLYNNKFISFYEFEKGEK